MNNEIETDYRFALRKSTHNFGTPLNKNVHSDITSNCGRAL